MSNAQRPLKAQLIELDTDFQPKSGGKQVTVQFNPETLKVSFANQIAQPNNAGANAAGPVPRKTTSMPRHGPGARHPRAHHLASTDQRSTDS